MLYGRLKKAARGLVTEAVAAFNATSIKHAGKTITLNRATGQIVTLPKAIGSNDHYQAVILTTVTSNNYTIKVVDSVDVMIGNAIIAQDAGDTNVVFEALAASDAIVMNGTTTGGLRGTIIRMTDVAPGVWLAEMVGAATGTEVTPFAAIV